MSLLDIAKNLKANGYDPRKDKVNNSNSNLPEGEYVVMLTDAKARVADSGWESINYAFEVRDPENPYNGRTQFVGYGTLTEWKKDGKTMDLTSMVETTVKFFQKSLELAEDKMKASDLEDIKTMEDALKRKAVGTKYVLVVSEYNRRNGEPGYNYDLEEYLGNKTGDTVEIREEDLPF